jgi:hypothetical protein
MSVVTFQVLRRETGEGMFPLSWQLHGSSLLIWAISANALLAAENEPLASGAGSGDTPYILVVRISEAALNSLLGDEIVDRQTEVRDVVLGTPVFGRARTIAQPGVRLGEDPDHLKFALVLRGNVNSRTTGYSGPARVYSRALTSFTATKEVTFEPGRGYVGRPAHVTSRTKLFTEGIGSSRGGLIGSIIRRRASRIVAAQKPTATAIASEKARRRIQLAFDRTGEERLARLNRTASFRTLVLAALRGTGDAEPRLVYSTTPEYLQIAATSKDQSLPIARPPADSTGRGQPPIAIWVHESLLGERVASMIRLSS